MMLRIRPETAEDADAIRDVNLAAFPTAQEANLVEALRRESAAEISLVAAESGTVIGHVMLSRMAVEGDGRLYRALGLAPVAVTPDRHGQGIGAALIEEALRRAQERGEEIAFLLGEPDYYRRFGFTAQAAAPFASPYAGKYFQAKLLDDDLEPPSSGRADYAPAFAGLE